MLVAGGGGRGAGAGDVQKSALEKEAGLQGKILDLSTALLAVRAAEPAWACVYWNRTRVPQGPPHTPPSPPLQALTTPAPP